MIPLGGYLAVSPTSDERIGAEPCKKMHIPRPFPPFTTDCDNAGAKFELFPQREAYQLLSPYPSTARLAEITEVIESRRSNPQFASGVRGQFL
jgi:hypothetical protein